MNSGGSGSGLQRPAVSPVTPYGQTRVQPAVHLLPDSIGADGRMPMATGLDQSHLDAIRSAPPPPPLSAQQGASGQDLKAMLAQMLAEQRGPRFMSKDWFARQALGGSLGGGMRSDSGNYGGGGGGGSAGGMGRW